MKNFLHYLAVYQSEGKLSHMKICMGNHLELAIL